MKRPTTTLCLFKSLTAGLFLFLGLGCQSSDTGSLDKKAEEFITVSKLSERAILVKLGYDAVIAVATQQGIVVIDAGISKGLTLKYRKLIEKELGRNDFTYLINTHAHPDHIGGNQAFPEAVIVGHENYPKEISDGWKEPEKIKSAILKIVHEYDKEVQASKPGSEEWKTAFCQKIRYQYAYNDQTGDTVIKKPDVTFNDRLTVFMGDATVHLIYFGKAHSGCDIVIYIPEMKLLMTGDLFFPGGIPSNRDFGKNDVERWKSTMEWIMVRQHEIDKVIGGHGQLMTPEDLASFNDYVVRKWKELN